MEFINVRRVKAKSWIWGLALGIVIGHFGTLYFFIIRGPL